MNDRCSRGIKMQQVQQKYNEVKGFSSRYDDITDTEKHDRKLNMNERFGAANLRDHKSKSVTTKWGKKFRSQCDITNPLPNTPERSKWFSGVAGRAEICMQICAEADQVFMAIDTKDLKVGRTDQ